MSFFKSNTTTTTNATTNEANQETTNNNGGLLKGIAIGVGTLAGIGAAYFGHKVYKSHHIVSDESNLEDVNVDDEEGSENVTENNETVESFNEVETDETNESAPVETEEAKTEETVNEAPVDEHSETEELVSQLTEEASKCASIKTASSLISSIKKMDETVGSVAGMYRTIGDNAKIDSAIAELYKAFNSYWNNLDTKISNCDKESFVACASEIDDVNNAWWDMQYIQMNRLATETMSYVINKYAHMERVAKRKEQKATLAAETQAAQKSSDETQAEEKKSAGETKTTDNAFDVFKDGHKESNKVEHETKSSTKASNKKQPKTKTSKTAGETKTADTRNIEAIAKESVARESLEKRLGNLKRLQKDNDEDADKQIMRDIAMVDFNVETLRKLAVSDIHDIETIACRCGSLAIDHYIEYTASVIKNTNLDNQKSLINIRASLMTIKGVVDTLENIVIYPKTRVHLEKVIRFADVRENELFQIKLEKTMSIENKVVDETQTTTKEVPSETQIGNSTVISDDGETVTLKASVSDDSVQNVMDVIDIVSKIPNRENPEKNDMPYFIRVIGGRISGITEPEATFLAYNDKTKSNDFIDACVSLCNMVGTGICNLADQKSNPIGSLGWINRSYDELIASGVIDNTYNPQAMRDVLTKARNEATRVLADMIKKSDEIKVEEGLTYTMSDKIQEAVSDQQSDETAATTEPESTSQAPMSPEASSLAAKLQEVGELMRAEKWSDASEFYKTQLTPYLADDGLTKELREEIMSIKTKATNMMMSQKQLEAKKKAASAKASKKKSSKRRRH